MKSTGNNKYDEEEVKMTDRNDILFLCNTAMPIAL
jgi:hypothetical protein